MKPENTFCHKNVPARIREILLGPEPIGEIIEFDDSWTLSHVMHNIGWFKSVGDARKNGWNKPIEKGWSELTVSKFKTKVFIVNDHPVWHEIDT